MECLAKYERSVNEIRNCNKEINILFAFDCQAALEILQWVNYYSSNVRSEMALRMRVQLQIRP